MALVTQVAVFHNKRAFDQLVREYQSPVRRFLLSQTMGNEALSDDLAQDTFLKAYTHIAQYRGTSSFLTWLTRIAYNVWYDYCRSQKVRVNSEKMPSGLPVGSVESMAAAGSSLFALHSSLKMDLYDALAILKEGERTCIALQLVEGYGIDEIADIMKMPVGTVKSHLKRGKDKLANYLRENGYDR